jgi:hypothetical protein
MAIAPPAVSTAAEHLAAHLAWLRELLAWQVDVTRGTFGALAADEYRGLYVPDAEVELLRTGPTAISPQLAARRAELTVARADLAAAETAALDQGVRLPLPRLAALFGLSGFDRDVLLLGLAAELDLRFERLFGYIQDDVTKKRPTVDLALRLLTNSPAERVAARAAFGPTGPLVRHRLLHVYEDGQRQAPLLARYFKVEDRIVAELLADSPESAPVDAAIATAVSFERPRRPLEGLLLAADLGGRLQATVRERRGGLVLALQGTYGSGRLAVAQALTTLENRPMLVAMVDRLVAGDEKDADHHATVTGAIERVLREAELRDAAIFWQGAGRILREDGEPGWRAMFLAALDQFNGLSFLSLDKPWDPRGELRQAAFVRVELPAPSFSEREALWARRLNGEGPGSEVLQVVASTFRLSAGQIRDAAHMARAIAGWRTAGSGGKGQVESADLFAACRAQSSGRLDALAHKITTTYRWDDIVLPADQVTQLREITLQVRHRKTVLEHWGFDRHLAMGKGVNVLFAGQSGTGKTMAADIIASDLGLELYKIDLSTMVSKYIGETEKNLDQVFSAAREANAILFFDEADALFGKRSEVKDAHDRYANIEVGYLLQKMEAFDGVAILATNLRKNLDDAFVRRLHVTIEFPFPEDADRLRIWRKVFPAAAPLEPDVDLLLLARQFKLAGGNIRNIALLAAYLAAEEGATIGMNHLIRAVKREYQKMGKLVTEGDFGTWFALAKGVTDEFRTAS